MIIGKTRTNQPVEGNNDALALTLTGKDIAPKDVAATGNISAPSIIEDMEGYSYDVSQLNANITLSYCGCVKNGNKITFVVGGVIESSSDISQYSTLSLGVFNIPSTIGDKLFKIGSTNQIDFRKIFLYEDGELNQSDDVFAYINKSSNTTLAFVLRNKNLIKSNTKYFFRYECTFLLSDNMVSQE